AGRSLDRGRRRLLLGLGGLVVGGVAGVVSKARAGQELLRPPGAADEARFVSRCIGCGACLAGCPSGGLRPMLALDRLEAAFSPRLVPRIGPCLPDCAACGTACPTGAIARLSLEQKLAVRIGLAVIDQTLCLPWASRQRCVICLDACPPQWHAIELRRVGPAEFRPFVEPSRCTGCGICEHRCPVEGEAAVRVLPFGSSARGKDIVSLGAKA
ncbi:MAG: 4Fe-4S dicluster domain-containing protein, partial [Verrucomicrobiae bacterium]|nr:4Fe-4S dicluster domain-containing protein [Verrucomicrobiae bacterium]